ncbi:hypothetical protein A2W14_05625 [Candidatus Gottesmanbacteria bacterium RBG_16_37_8]|uniref:DUF5667 domain-containing protein n=1 Tax=Candidatus Gottesmanbacteria bacterium RBG_16_37_8 TaxID=1798371 RepID=A0A1F5YUN6_9BACT|nr:MAG: hypothetical protein A2W14_05625 [Candidatus Gottesmanbacteria bacterium RBG_16_37_8]
MKKIILIFLLILLTLASSSGQASAVQPATPTPVDYRLPYPGILPDHPLYPVKRFRDFLLLTFNRHPLKKIDLFLLLSDKKIGMSELLLSKRKVNLAVDTLLESQFDLLKAAFYLPDLSKNNLLPTGLSDKIELSAKKHQEIIGQISVSITDLKQKEKINQALQLISQANTLTQSVK